MEEAPASRNGIIDIADGGLVMQVDGDERVVAWSAILSVSAVMALADRTSERRIAVFVLAIMDGADKRLFIVGETEPMWERLISALPGVLPGMPGKEIWTSELAVSGKASLYARVGGVQ